MLFCVKLALSKINYSIDLQAEIGSEVSTDKQSELKEEKSVKDGEKIAKSLVDDLSNIKDVLSGKLTDVQNSVELVGAVNPGGVRGV